MAELKRIDGAGAFESTVRNQINDNFAELETRVNNLGGGTETPLTWSPVPKRSTTPCAAGEMAYSGEFLFVAVEDDHWMRVALEEW